MDKNSNEKDVPEDFEFAALNEAHNYRRALIASFAPYMKGDVIEVGSGIGQMTAQLRKIGDIKFLQCIEPNENFCREIRNLFPSQPLINGTINDVKKTDWNAIVSINVLEHIEDDTLELKKYGELLKARNGIFCLFVPARQEIYAPLDKAVGHFRRYTKKSITDKLVAAGFEIKYIRYYNFAGYFAWGIIFCLMKSKNFNPRSVRFFDRFIFPVVHFVESNLCRPPIGQSIMVIARAK